VYLTWPLAAPKIGVFFYVWYSAPGADNWNHPKFVDFPVAELGNYTSTDPIVIERQLGMIADAGIDFVVVSWHGFYDDYGHFNDNATNQVFQTAQKIGSPLKFLVFVEHFNKTQESTYDYKGIYDYVWDKLVQPYDSLYYKTNDKPVICFYNDPYNSPGLTPNGSVPQDNRFNAIIVGQENYAQWIHTDADIYDLPQHEPKNQTSVAPRFDESRIEGRKGFMNDSTLAEGLYDNEWNQAIELWRQGKIQTILIYSWNEYVERSAIEPHNDGTSVYPDPFYLYSKTESYIAEIRQQAAK
jgi:hypothetical protein